MVYKVVPGPKNIEVKSGQADNAFAMFGDIINREAQAGWTYHSMETLSVTEKACFQANTVNYYMLIFERQL